MTWWFYSDNVDWTSSEGIEIWGSLSISVVVADARGSGVSTSVLASDSEVIDDTERVVSIAVDADARGSVDSMESRDC